MYDAEGTEGFWPSGRLSFRSRKYAAHYITVSGQMCHKDAKVEYIIFPAYEEVDLLFISTDCNSVKGFLPNRVCHTFVDKNIVFVYVNTFLGGFSSWTKQEGKEHERSDRRCQRLKVPYHIKV